jgi:hypothetical protein
MSGAAASTTVERFERLDLLAFLLAPQASCLLFPRTLNTEQSKQLCAGPPLPNALGQLSGHFWI